jgi:hypothetical protein
LKTVTAIFERIEQLSVFPNRGRVGLEEGTRELVLSPLRTLLLIAFRT